ncbi:RagB/SusD family nutrient uptake outer membrane protein [Marinifilum sp. D714]|uniref:RagB/SusD family nutrient uptake outer membrane protein n=1 Tax=Marinifilum sp. D714 TaxID=2937523 RepID=UPI0027CB5730|nr:RagB/SusD family nutrient uptake outer membrane protein [Marinifilum sp. D714]MDQ2180127.1 RagB/SusD family nutrient uptake outer membrane protein [Marinifilum sp. D714]
MKKNIIGLACALLFVLAGCSEDFLERSPSDQVSSTNFFTQEKDLVYAVNAVYASIGFNSWETTYGYSTDLLRIENLTDNALDHHSWNAGYRLADGTASAYDWYVEHRWRERYRGIQRANRIFEGADGVTDINAEKKARLLAEAKFLRAYFYFDLVYLFGDVPFITNSVTPDEAAESTRTAKQTILDAMVTDLTAAATDLPTSYSSDNLGRATKGAALSLKARILLYQEKWGEAAAAAKEVMDLTVYTIYPSYQEMFTYEGINNSEVIFDLQEMHEKQWNFTLQNYGPNSVGGWSSGCPLQSLVDTYECTDGKTIDVSPLFDANNPYANRDPRLTHSILYPGHDWRGGVFNSIPGATYPGKEIIAGDDLTDGTGGQWNKTATGYNWLKYISEDDIDNGDYWNGAIHFILIRYAEVLLTYAEAKIENDDIDQSVYDAINEVRQRPDVNMPLITTGKSKEELRTIVRRERRVELAFEGLRLLDIRRWKIAENVMPGVPNGLTYTDPNSGEEVTLSWGERTFNPNKHYLWPIPQAEIDISHLEQNPGW